MLLKSAKGEGRSADICGQSTSTGNTSLRLTEVWAEVENYLALYTFEAHLRGQYPGYSAVTLRVSWRCSPNRNNSREHTIGLITITPGQGSERSLAAQVGDTKAQEVLC